MPGCAKIWPVRWKSNESCNTMPDKGINCRFVHERKHDKLLVKRIFLLLLESINALQDWFWFYAAHQKL